MNTILLLGMTTMGLTTDDITGPRAPHSYTGTNHHCATGLKTRCSHLICQDVFHAIRTFVSLFNVYLNVYLTALTGS